MSKKILPFTTLTTLFVLCSVFSSWAQTDSTKTYDMVYLTKGGIIKGEIMSFSEEIGTLVIKDTQGRVYTLGKEEYNYYIENQVETEKPPKVIWPRRTEGNLVNVGFNYAQISGPSYVMSKANSSELNGTFSFGTVNVNLGLGKIIEQAHYAGLVTEFSIASLMDHYFNAGLRYSYSFLKENRNSMLYLPFEARYFDLKYTEEMNHGNGEVETVSMKMNSVGLTAGIGLSFSRPKGKIVSLEYVLSKHFPSTLMPSELPVDYSFSAGKAELFTTSLGLIFSL